jgi:hypothetical protein
MRRIQRNEGRCVPAARNLVYTRNYIESWLPAINVRTKEGRNLGLKISRLPILHVGFSSLFLMKKAVIEEMIGRDEAAGVLRGGPSLSIVSRDSAHYQAQPNRHAGISGSTPNTNAEPHHRQYVSDRSTRIHNFGHPYCRPKPEVDDQPLSARSSNTDENTSLIFPQYYHPATFPQTIGQATRGPPVIAKSPLL